jgi:hypothetical protein
MKRTGIGAVTYKKNEFRNAKTASDFSSLAVLFCTRGLLAMTSLTQTAAEAQDGAPDMESTDGARLHELESIIKRGLNTFIEVGKALHEIRDRGLYSETTFEEYCWNRWGMKRQTAYDHIKASEVVENVRTCVQSQPSLGQARELAALSPDQQRDVSATVDFSTVTVQEVKRKVREVKDRTKLLTMPATKETLPDLSRRDVRRATAQKHFEKLIIRLGKSYERFHSNIASIRFIHDDAGQIKAIEITPEARS